MMNNDIGYWVVMIYQATMLHGLSTLEEYWANAKILIEFDLWVKRYDGHIVGNPR